jgi:hypothetical protein
VIGKQNVPSRKSSPRQASPVAKIVLNEGERSYRKISQSSPQSQREAISSKMKLLILLKII